MRNDLRRQKLMRIYRMVTLLSVTPDGLRQIEIARQLGVPRYSVLRDVIAAEGYGIRLAEDADGRLSLADAGSRHQRCADCPYDFCHTMLGIGPGIEPKTQ